jgi:hypothetical protein
MRKVEYSKFHKGNSSISKEFWLNHPDWNWYVRTNVRYSRNPKVWLGAGGETLEKAIEAAMSSIRCDALPSLVMNGECVIVGDNKEQFELVESATIISNQGDK